MLFIESANDLDPLKRAIIDKRVSMVMRGLIDIKESPGNHIIYNHQNRDLFHLFSAKSFGHTFGFREYSKFMSIKEFLDSPVDILDDVLEGFGRGTEDLMAQREKAAKDAAKKAGSITANEEAALRAATNRDK